MKKVFKKIKCWLRDKYGSKDALNIINHTTGRPILK